MEKDFLATGGVDTIKISEEASLLTLRKSGYRKLGSAILYHVAGQLVENKQIEAEIIRIENQKTHELIGSYC